MDKLPPTKARSAKKRLLEIFSDSYKKEQGVILDWINFTHYGEKNIHGNTCSGYTLGFIEANNLEQRVFPDGVEFLEKGVRSRTMATLFIEQPNGIKEIRYYTKDK